MRHASRELRGAKCDRRDRRRTLFLARRSARRDVAAAAATTTPPPPPPPPPLPLLARSGTPEAGLNSQLGAYSRACRAGLCLYGTTAARPLSPKRCTQPARRTEVARADTVDQGLGCGCSDRLAGVGATRAARSRSAVLIILPDDPSPPVTIFDPTERPIVRRWPGHLMDATCSQWVLLSTTHRHGPTRRTERPTSGSEGR